MGLLTTPRLLASAAHSKRSAYSPAAVAAHSKGRWISAVVPIVSSSLQSSDATLTLAFAMSSVDDIFAWHVS